MKTIQKVSQPSVVINDIVVRVVGISGFALTIPNALGLLHHGAMSVRQVLWSYGCFFLISFCIWQGNRFLLFKIEARLDWFIYPFQKVLLILGANILYTSLVVVVMLSSWYYSVHLPIDWEAIKVTTLICIVCVVFVTHTYETFFLIRQQQTDRLQSEQLERAKVEAELEVLKNQIDPHFMFNSLNSLSFLIERDPARAKEFTESLADVYRYILSNKTHTLVLLEDELLFLRQYMNLLFLRFKHCLQVKFHTDHAAEIGFLIPPLSIFVALENVVKHNEISERYPMTVTIRQEADSLSVSNPLRPRRTAPESSKIGLKNLQERFRIIMAQEATYRMIGNSFELHLPLLPLSLSL